MQGQRRSIITPVCTAIEKKKKKVRECYFTVDWLKRNLQEESRLAINIEGCSISPVQTKEGEHVLQPTRQRESQRKLTGRRRNPQNATDIRIRPNSTECRHCHRRLRVRWLMRLSSVIKEQKTNKKKSAFIYKEDTPMQFLLGHQKNCMPSQTRASVDQALVLSNVWDRKHYCGIT